MALAKQFRLTGYHLLRESAQKNFDFGLFPGGIAVARRSINQVLKPKFEKKFITSSAAKDD
jgi:hypothetical protein